MKSNNCYSIVFAFFELLHQHIIKQFSIGYPFAKQELIYAKSNVIGSNLTMKKKKNTIKQMDTMNNKAINKKKLTENPLCRGKKYKQKRSHLSSKRKKRIRQSNNCSITQNTPDITITNPDPPDFLINGKIVGVI